jgi:hypothetical protein
MFPRAAAQCDATQQKELQVALQMVAFSRENLGEIRVVKSMFWSTRDANVKKRPLECTGLYRKLQPGQVVPNH